MATKNYGFDKRRRELEKKRKREAKREKRRERRSENGGTAPAGEDGALDSPGETPGSGATAAPGDSGS